MIFSNAVIFEINTLPSSPFLLYQPVVLTISVKLCYLCILIHRYSVYIYYAAGCKGYICDIITCVCTVDFVPVQINYRYCAGIKNDYNAWVCIIA